MCAGRAGGRVPGVSTARSGQSSSRGGDGVLCRSHRGWAWCKEQAGSRSFRNRLGAPERSRGGARSLQGQTLQGRQGLRRGHTQLPGVQRSPLQRLSLSATPSGPGAGLGAGGFGAPCWTQRAAAWIPRLALAGINTLGRLLARHCSKCGL